MCGSVPGSASCLTRCLTCPHCPHACRGHLGGLVGGAGLAYLLGPKLMRNAAGNIVDSPPVPWLAYKGSIKPGSSSGSSSSGGGGGGGGGSTK